MNDINKHIMKAHSTTCIKKLLSGRASVPLSETIPSLWNEEEDMNLMEGIEFTDPEGRRAERKTSRPIRINEDFDYKHKFPDDGGESGDSKDDNGSKWENVQSIEAIKRVRRWRRASRWHRAH